LDPQSEVTARKDPSNWLPAGFNKLPPEVAHRFLDLVADQLQHQHWLDKQEMRLAARGQWIAVSLCVFFGLVSLVMTLTGHDAVGGTIAGTTIAALATTFIVGRRSKR
jgi:uncharacterized membrane protein